MTAAWSHGVYTCVLLFVQMNMVPSGVWKLLPRMNQTCGDLHKSGSSLEEISKRLKVPRSSVQTIVRKYKHHGTMQLSYRSGRRRVLSPRDECTLVQKVQINPRRTAKYLVKMLEETGTKVSISK
ncbi:unnamed protein product [Oncorhynchus mykiss]|uniref:Sleeping Beauty transposase HTH domain-containing protein n=1 Tax=Oncorhynchus mykiss TaxID=8022 RepID=A0A060XKU4_ONCMY|nr:unnamed protein product [Oncorhynchus mykiss]